MHFLSKTVSEIITLYIGLSYCCYYYYAALHLDRDTLFTTWIEFWNILMSLWLITVCEPERSLHSH